VDSKPGLGTTFTILLPIAQEDDVVAETPSETQTEKPDGDPLKEAEQALEAI